MHHHISEFFGKSDGNRTINNASDLAMYFLEEANVSMVTGEAFGAPNCIRLSYAASREELQTGIARVKDVLAKLN